MAKAIANRFPGTRASLPRVLWARTMGVLFMGFVPAILFYLISHEKQFTAFFLWPIQNGTFIWIAVVGTVVILASYVTRFSKENLKNYPQIKVSPWHIQIGILNFVSWFGFLLSYEFLFRGILFFSVYETWGFWPSITINTMLYALMHFPKSRRETLGALPFGFILCYITFDTGSVWAAFGIHLIMAVSNDYFARLAHSELQSS